MKKVTPEQRNQRVFIETQIKNINSNVADGSTTVEQAATQLHYLIRG